MKRTIVISTLAAALAVPGLQARAEEKPAMPSLKEMQSFSSTLKGETPPPKTPVRPQGPHSKVNPHYKLTPEKHVQVALQHLAEGRPVEAMKALDMAIALYPDNYQLRGVRASLYLQHKKYAKALADLEVALKSRPDDPLLLVNRAQAYRGFRRDREALEDLDHAIRVKPDFIGALFNRGALHFEKKRYKEALADFEKVAELDPHLPAARFNIAVTYESLGDRKRAMKELEDFLKVTKHKGWIAIARKQLNNWRKMEGLPEIDFAALDRKAGEQAGAAKKDGAAAPAKKPQDAGGEKK